MHTGSKRTQISDLSAIRELILSGYEKEKKLKKIIHHTFL